MKNVAVMGLGYISKRVAEGVALSQNANLYAFASRDINKAKEMAEKMQVSYYYGSYEEMLANPDIDVVYICTPNALHYDQIMLCLSYGKHVVCEKPMVADEVQVKKLFAEARRKGCFLMEAEKTMFTPLNVKLKQMVREGVIGKLQAIRAEYSYDVLKEVDTDHWVLEKEMGGSAYDIGVYPISFAHFMAGSKMQDLQVEKLMHPEYSCDFGMQADILYENGVYGFLKTNWFYTAEHKGSAILAGDEGYIKVPAFWKSTKAYLYKDGKVEEISVEMESDFEGEVTHAAECIEKGLLESPVLGEEMSLEIVRVVDYTK